MTIEGPAVVAMDERHRARGWLDERTLIEWIRARNLTMDCVQDPAGDRIELAIRLAS